MTLAVGARREGFTDRRLYTDAAVFERELAQIFGRVWLFLCHEDELRGPGAFKCLTLADQPVLVVRGQDGQIRAFFNSCRHRGTEVESHPNGQREAFRCPYHHWTYDTAGRLTYVPVEDGYGAWFRKADYGLVPLPQLATHSNLVFGSLNPGVMPLREYLGEAADYLTESVTYNGEELVVIGSYEYTIQANWKLLAENTMDGYHPDFLHGVAFAQRRALQRTSETATARVSGHALDLGIHGALIWEQNPAAFVFQKERRVSTYTAIFPNLLALYNAARDAINVRVIVPVAVDEMLVRNYCLGRRSDTPAVVERRVQGFSISWGPGGRVTADDITALNRVQRGLKARNGAGVLIARGLEGGPEGRYEDDQALRAFWRGWRQYMEMDSSPAPTG